MCDITCGMHVYQQVITGTYLNDYDIVEKVMSQASTTLQLQENSHGGNQVNVLITNSETLCSLGNNTTNNAEQSAENGNIMQEVLVGQAEDATGIAI